MSKIVLLKPKATPVELPIITNKVPAGFPSPAEEYLGDTLDLNAYVIKNPATTFFARVEGDSMVGAGIMPDDILVVDRSKQPKNKDVVIAIVDGEMTVKRLRTDEGIQLLPENPKYSPINITGEMEFSVWGVVTFRVGSV